MGYYVPYTQISREVMAATIWIANNAGHAGYDKAKEIAGPDAVIKPLTLGNINSLHVDRLIWELARGIVKYVKPEDYLIFSGTAIIPATALLLWIEMYDQCNVLLWYAARKEYRLSTITKENIKNILDQHLMR
jgi:hypothetical protein